MIFQIIISFILNISEFLSGTILIDDMFFGLFGFPRAYQFTYFAVVLSFFIFCISIKKKAWNLFLLFALFFSVQFFAGAGRIILIYFIILFIGSLYLFKLNFISWKTI